MMENNPPLNLAELDCDLRTQLADAGVAFAELPHVLRHYAVAGAIFNKAGDLYEGDLATIRNSALQLTKAGIPLHPDTKFYFYNLLAPIHCDILAINGRYKDDVEYPKADVLAVCGVWGGEAHGLDHTVWYLRESQKKPFDSFREMYGDYSLPGVRNDRLTTISEYQREGAWPLAAHNLGIKMVVTRGPDGIDAINSGDFELPPYRTLIDTRENFAPEYSSVGGGLGILIHEDYLAAHDWKTLSARDHLLGERLAAVKGGNHFERVVEERKRADNKLLRQAIRQHIARL
jgi:hypothetical protein